MLNSLVLKNFMWQGIWELEFLRNLFSNLGLGGVDFRRDNEYAIVEFAALLLCYRWSVVQLV